MKKLFQIVLVLICFVFFSVSSAVSQEDSDLKFGMSAAFSGPAKELGSSMRIGIEAYFERVNSKGGIDGRRLKLLAIDDSYEPAYAASNAFKLINNESVTAFIGNVGTPTAKAAIPITIENKILYYAPFSGSSLLRPYQDKDYLIKSKDSYTYDKNKYIINFRASYVQETEKIIENLLESGIKPYEIAIFTQDDSYGFDGYRGAVQALEKRGYQNSRKIPYGTYQRNSLDIERGLLDILTSKRNIRAVIVVGSYKPVAKFIKFARKLIPNSVFINVSFVGCLPLADLLPDSTNEVFVTQVVPHFNSNSPIIEQYRADLEKYFPNSKPNFVSLEGYISAYIFVEGLKNANGDFSSDGIIKGIQTLNHEGLNLDFDLFMDEYDHQLSDNVWITEINEDACDEISWKEFRNLVRKITHSSGG